MKKKLGKLSLSVIISILYSNVNATSELPSPPAYFKQKLLMFQKNLHPIASFLGGAAIAKIGQSQIYAPLDLCYYAYRANRYSVSSFFGGFLGTEIPLNTKRLAALDIGVGYYLPSALTGTGQLVQGADAASASVYQYSYNVLNRQLLLESRLLFNFKQGFYPYVALGLGAAFNKAYNYKTNVPPFYEYTPYYANRSQSNFAYMLGAGFDLTLLNNWRAGAGYRFSGLGKVNLGRGSIDSIPIATTLIQSNLNASQIFLQLTFIG